MLLQELPDLKQFVRKDIFVFRKRVNFIHSFIDVDSDIHEIRIITEKTLEAEKIRKTMIFTGKQKKLFQLGVSFERRISGIESETKNFCIREYGSDGLEGCKIEGLIFFHCAVADRNLHGLFHREFPGRNLRIAVDGHHMPQSFGNKPGPFRKGDRQIHNVITELPQRRGRSKAGWCVIQKQPGDGVQFFYQQI